MLCVVFIEEHVLQHKSIWKEALSSLSVSLQHLEYSIGTAFVSIAGIA